MKISAGQTALITGPTAGIGLSFAHNLAAAGMNLVLVARDEERLRALQADLTKKYQISVELLAADLTDREQLDQVAVRCADLAQPIDLLINNAGFGLKERFADNSIATEQAQLDILVVAVVRLSHAALAAMSSRGLGGIINVSSVAGFLPRGTYSAAKAYVTSFSEWAHYEYAASGIQVMALCPGFVRTEFHQRMGVAQNSAPDFMWLDSDKLVAETMADFAAGKAISIPSVRYKAIVGAARAVPNVLLQKFQGLGRK